MHLFEEASFGMNADKLSFRLDTEPSSSASFRQSPSPDETGSIVCQPNQKAHIEGTIFALSVLPRPLNAHNSGGVDPSLRIPAHRLKPWPRTN